ncbi:hypothetical protein SALBM135S_03441 [Streptomyces alboniger]
MTLPLYWLLPVPFSMAWCWYSFLPVAASVMTWSLLGVPSFCTPVTTVVNANTGLPEAAQITLRGAWASACAVFAFAAVDSADFATEDLPSFASVEEPRDGGLGRLGDALDLAALRGVHDEVAAEDGQAVVGALVTGVGGAVGVLDDVAEHHQLLLGAEADPVGGRRSAGARVLEEVRVATDRVMGEPDGSVSLTGCAEAPVDSPAVSSAPAATVVAIARVERLRNMSEVTRAPSAGPGGTKGRPEQRKTRCGRAACCRTCSVLRGRRSTNQVHVRY